MNIQFIRIPPISSHPPKKEPSSPHKLLKLQYIDMNASTYKNLMNP